MDFLLLFLIICGIMFLLAAPQKKKQQQLKRYWDITLGMSEHEMLSIMGYGYNRSLLKNGRIKYEWRINASSFGVSTKGFSSRTYSGVKKWIYM